MSVCQSFPNQDTYCVLPLGHIEPHSYRSHHDYDFDRTVGGAQYQIERGGYVWQKFTCQHCGNRLTIEEHNVFHTEGDCDSCGGRTNIKANGCNYLLLMGKNDRASTDAS